MQDDPAKKNINTTVAIRLLLDNASTVDDAIALLKQYNMRMYNTDNKHNYHYLMADAKGNYAIVEYTRDPSNPDEEFPTRMEVLRHNDTLRCVTNFYVSPTMAGTNDGWGSQHGLTRYRGRAFLQPSRHRLQRSYERSEGRCGASRRTRLSNTIVNVRLVEPLGHDDLIKAEIV